MAWTPENNAQLAMALRDWAGSINSSYIRGKGILRQHDVNVAMAKEQISDADGIMTAAEMDDVISLVRALVNLAEQGTPIDAQVGPIIARALRNVGV